MAIKIDMRMRALEDRELVSLVDRIATERARKERKPVPKSYSSVPTSTTISGEQSTGATATITKIVFSGTPTRFLTGDGRLAKLRTLKARVGTPTVGRDAFSEADFAGSLDTVVLEGNAVTGPVVESG